MVITDTNSVDAFEDARKILPGGVNSPVRAFRSIGRSPVFIEKGKGAYMWDIDNNQYIDYCLSWGTLILGHAHEAVLEAVKSKLTLGTSFGCPTLIETELARLIADSIPSIEKIRFVNSGTEAVMSAIRLARAYTGRNIIVKFDGCYHGHSDSLLVAAGSGLANTPDSSSKGVPQEIVQNTVSLPFNNLPMFEQYIQKHGYDVAGVIFEIVPANMGLILPDPQFINLINSFSKQYKYLVIADEVITGFRFPEGSAQQHFGIKPHLTTLGKIIGGGFPVGAYGGSREIMQLIAPEGEVYQAGTLSGNPIAMNAGFTTLSVLRQLSTFQKLSDLSNCLSDNLRVLAGKYKFSYHLIGNMFSVFLTNKPIRDFDTIKNNSDEIQFASFYRHLLNHHIYFSPSLYETNFISTAHTLPDLNQSCEILEDALKLFTP